MDGGEERAVGESRVEVMVMKAAAAVGSTARTRVALGSIMWLSQLHYGVVTVLAAGNSCGRCIRSPDTNPYQLVLAWSQ